MKEKYFKVWATPESWVALGIATKSLMKIVYIREYGLLSVGFTCLIDMFDYIFEKEGSGNYKFPSFSFISKEDIDEEYRIVFNREKTKDYFDERLHKIESQNMNGD